MYQLECDWQGAIENAKEAVHFFSNLGYEHPIPVTMFMNKLAMAYLHLGVMHKAKPVIDRALSMSPQPNFSLAITHEMLFIAHMHESAFDQAEAALDWIDRFCKKRGAGAQMPERLMVYRMYLAIATSDMDSVRLQRTLNDLDAFSQDHSAMNLALIIADLIIRTAQSGNMDYLRSSHERLTKYMQRHLKGKQSRARIFVKMILALPTALYDIQKFERKENKLLDQLAALPRSRSIDSEEMEVIPYPDLWRKVKYSLTSNPQIHESGKYP